MITIRNLFKSLNPNLKFEQLTTFQQEVVSQKVRVYLWSKDTKGKFLSCNEAMVQDNGLTKESDIIGLTDFDLYWGKHATALRENDKRIMSVRKSYLYEEPVKIVDHIGIICHSYKAPLFSNTKKILGTTGVGFVFIDERKEANHSCYRAVENNAIFQTFSFQEKQCLKYLLHGKTNKEIAKLLNLSPRTVEEYVNRLKLKSGCQYKRELITFFRYLYLD